MTMSPQHADEANRDTATPSLEVETANGNDVSSKPDGYVLRWSRLQKTVTIKEDTSGLMGRSSISSRAASTTTTTNTQQRVILHHVSGCAVPGQVLALMGPSGSGKTSLLNVISGRASFDQGVLSINGQAHTTASSAALKKQLSKVAYVQQADIFFGHLTVRDQFSYTAFLRLPQHWPKARKHAEVDKIIDMLRLNKVADSPIMMLSGGEKKRVNIGTELLTEPTTVLLDEPSSGLDSTSAVSLIQLLQTLAKDHGKTIVTSIHQPNSAMFRSFDQLLLLSEGHVVYFGSPVQSLDYLSQRDLACPEGYNAADHWMDLLVIDSMVEGHQSKTGESPRALLQEAWDHEAVAEEMDQALAREGRETGDQALQQLQKYNTSWLTQYYYLAHRALKNSQSAIFTKMNLVKSVALGLVAGMLWFQIDMTERYVGDIRSYFFFTQTYWVFDSSFGALMSFPPERKVILKERSSKSYHLGAYFLAKTTSDMPVRIILPLLYMVVSYWMAGFEDRFVNFIGSVFCTLLSCVAGEAVGLLIGTAILDSQTALTFMTVFTLFLMLLGGFFVDNVPTFVSWAKYLSPFKYAFDASLQVIFDRDIPCDGSGELQDLCFNATSVSSEEVLDFLGVQGSLAFNVGMLLLICFVPRYAAYWALRLTKSTERS